jgi:hypothetical protein
MRSPASLGTKAKPARGAPRGEPGARGGAASNGRPAEAMRTKTGPRSAPGAVVQALASARGPTTAPCRRCRRRQPWLSQRAVVSIPTRRAALGGCRATDPRSAIRRSKHPRVGRGPSSGPRAWAPDSHRLCACCVAAVRAPCRGMADACRADGTFVSSTPAHRRSGACGQRSSPSLPAEPGGVHLCGAWTTLICYNTSVRNQAAISVMVP